MLLECYTCSEYEFLRPRDLERSRRKRKRKRGKMNEESSDNLNFEIVVAEEFYTSWVCLDGSLIS